MGKHQRPWCLCRELVPLVSSSQKVLHYLPGNPQAGLLVCWPQGRWHLWAFLVDICHVYRPEAGNGGVESLWLAHSANLRNPCVSSLFLANTDSEGLKIQNLKDVKRKHQIYFVSSTNSFSNDCVVYSLVLHSDYSALGGLEKEMKEKQYCSKFPIYS